MLAESDNVETELQDVDLFKLMTVLKSSQTSGRRKKQTVHQVIQYPYTIEGQTQYLLGQVTTRKRVSFVEIIEAIKPELR